MGLGIDRWRQTFSSLVTRSPSPSSPHRYTGKYSRIRRGNPWRSRKRLPNPAGPDSVSISHYLSNICLSKNLLEHSSQLLQSHISWPAVPNQLRSVSAENNPFQCRGEVSIRPSGFQPEPSLCKLPSPKRSRGQATPLPTLPPPTASSRGFLHGDVPQQRSHGNFAV